MLCLGRTRELRVRDVVGEAAQVRRGVVALQKEVRIAVPSPHEEGPLVDDVRTLAKRPTSGIDPLMQSPSRRDLDDRPPFGPQAFEIGAFMLDALLLQQDCALVVRREGGGRDEVGHVEVRGVRASREVHEIACREDRNAVMYEHRQSLLFGSC